MCERRARCAPLPGVISSRLADAHRLANLHLAHAQALANCLEFVAHRVWNEYADFGHLRIIRVFLSHVLPIPFLDAWTARDQVAGSLWIGFKEETQEVNLPRVFSRQRQARGRDHQVACLYLVSAF